eukprot:2462894-Pyramimonas_sp.AAC.1
MSSDVDLEMHRYSCIFEMQVDRERRAKYPEVHACKSGVRMTAALALPSLAFWIHTTTMNEIYDE